MQSLICDVAIVEDLVGFNHDAGDIAAEKVNVVAHATVFGRIKIVNISSVLCFVARGPLTRT